MKNTKIILYLLLPALIFFGCKKQDFTNLSSLKPTSPTITVNFGTVSNFNDGVSSSQKVTLTMDVAQITDVKVWISSESGGTATEGTDYSIPSSVTIPAGRVSATFEVKCLKDDEYESTEDFTIKVGDDRTANATLVPVTQKYTIENFEDGDLALDLSWAPEAYDQYGEQIDATDIADMMLFIEAPDGTIDTIDGAGFESTVISGDSADGDYLIRVAFYDAMSFDDAVEMNLGLTSYQNGGPANSTLDFTGLISTETANTCNYHIHLAKITKSGQSYTITKQGNITYDLTIGNFVGKFAGKDGLEGPNNGYCGMYGDTVNFSLNGSDLMLNSGLCHGWMEDVWGEVDTIDTPVKIVLNEDGTISIASQPYMRTYMDKDSVNTSGDTVHYKVYTDYTLSGSGTWNGCSPASFHLEYELHSVPDDYDAAALLFSYELCDAPHFTADITLNAKGINVNNTKHPTINKNTFLNRR